MNAKIAITTTLKMLDSWVGYIKSSGYKVRKLHEGKDTTTYYADDAPGYGKLTPLARVFRDINNRPSTWIFVRIPLADEQSEELTDAQDEIAELTDEIELLKKEVARLKWRYQERCWCSSKIPASCGHHKLKEELG